jgi:hypothetical protein F3_00962
MHSFINKKGFKILKVSAAEVKAIGGFGICDGCNKPSEYGYLMPVVGSYWYCKKCYDDWNKRAKFYEEDREYEAKMNDRWVEIFKSKGIIDERD